MDAEVERERDPEHRGHPELGGPHGPHEHGGHVGDADLLDVGVLIELPEPLATRVRVLRETVGNAPEVPSHVTLVPPTTIEASALPGILEHVRTVAQRTPAFRLELVGTDTFQPVTDVVYLTVRGGAGDCDALQAALRSGPLDVDLRFPYHPHVTLAQDVPQAGLDRALETMAEVDEVVEVDRFTLFVAPVGSDDWSRVGEFALQGR